MSCGLCGAARAYMPAAIRKRLEEVQARIDAKKKSAIVPSYTTAAKPASTEAPRASSEIHPDGSGSAHDESGTIGSESLPAVGADL